MKKHLSTVVVGCLGLCAGFTLCYVYLVHPQRETKATASTPQQVRQQEQITIAIARDGSFYLAGERLDLSRLATRLKELAAQRQPVTIRADKDADFKRIAEVMDACKAAAVSQVAVATAATQ
jgi:biopolymer transport protein ExbD